MLSRAALVQLKGRHAETFDGTVARFFNIGTDIKPILMTKTFHVTSPIVAGNIFEHTYMRMRFCHKSHRLATDS